MPNQRDVARRAGVSSASVSRFLDRRSRVSVEVAARISSAIEDLGYRVDQSAQTLKTGKSRHLAILAPGTGPYFWQVSSLIQAELDQHDYFCTPLYSRTQDQSVYARVPIMEVLHRRQIDGAFFFPTEAPEDETLLDELIRWGKPLVIIDRSIPNPKIPQVKVDNHGAAAEAAREILARGHTQVLFLWGDRTSTVARERFEGFSAELRRQGVELGPDRQINGGFYSHFSYEETMSRWKEIPPFTAIFASNDSSALGFLAAARDNGLDCPRDFSIVGFDDNAEYAAFHNPPLATFRLPTLELAHGAAQQMLGLLEEEPIEHRILLSAPFQWRRSLQRPPQ